MHISSRATLQQTATRCNILPRTATHCNALQQQTWGNSECRQMTTKPCLLLYTYNRATLQHTATHCNTLQHTATHCNALQHAAIHCNKLPDTATYCNILQQQTCGDSECKLLTTKPYLPLCTSFRASDACNCASCAPRISWLPA